MNHSSHKKFYVAIGDKPEGPFSEGEILSMLKDGTISGESLTWHENLDAWVSLNELGIHPSETPIADSDDKTTSGKALHLRLGVGVFVGIVITSLIFSILGGNGKPSPVKNHENVKVNSAKKSKLASPTPPKEMQHEFNAGHRMAEAIAETTGTAIAPLFGISIISCLKYYRTGEKERDTLPWWNRPAAWGFGLFLIILFWANDVIGAIYPPLKYPMNVVEQFEDKISFALASPVVLSGLCQTAMEVGAATGPEVSSAGFNLGGWLLGLITFVAGLAAYVVTWMTSHTISIMILLSPWGGLDAVLRSLRGILLLLIYIPLQIPGIGPFVCIFICLAITLAGYFIARWSFRLVVFGTVCSWDIITFRHKRFHPGISPIFGFLHHTVKGAPKRSYGVISGGDNKTIKFTYKPWLVFPKKEITLDRKTRWIQKGFLSPLIVEEIEDAGGKIPILRLPPRYRGHQDYAIRELGLETLQLDQPIVKGLKNAWHSLKGRLGLDERIQMPKTVNNPSVPSG